MQRRNILKGLLACPICAAATAQAFASSKPHWDYGSEAGPEEWADLSSDYSVCGAGRQQSPIDLKHATRAETGTVSVDWTPARDFVFKNNGHTLQADMPKGNTSTVGGRSFELLQYHFHHQSEHTIDGKRYPMEAHFVHKAKEGDLMVLGAFLDKGEENPVLADLWQDIPETGQKTTIKKDVDAAKLLPEDSPYFYYMGSLTTPPCSEVVTWVVYEDTVDVSADQIGTFAKIYPHNNRPRQPVNRRQILLGNNAL